MRFAEQMRRIAWDLESTQDINVLQCIYSEAGRDIDEAALRKITLAHYCKIDLSDAIYVVDLEGYIGASVQSEIAYALANHKEVIYHSREMREGKL